MPKSRRSRDAAVEWPEDEQPHAENERSAVKEGHNEIHRPFCDARTNLRRCKIEHERERTSDVSKGCAD